METLLWQVGEIAVGAGAKILNYYGSDDFELKSDQTPITQADYASHHFICDQLRKISPYLISSEEDELAYTQRQALEYYWLIDPLDGTKDFLEHNDGFTVNIALIFRDKPIIGVVYAPALSKLFIAIEGGGAYRILTSCMDSSTWHKEKLEGERKVDGQWVGCDSIHHSSQKTQAFFDYYHLKRMLCGSSLKICSVAEGSADVYPRFNGTKEWDTAAADMILREAGGVMIDCESKKTLAYNKPSVKNPHFVALGKSQIGERMYHDLLMTDLWK